jgi:hypothetical protein
MCASSTGSNVTASDAIRHALARFTRHGTFDKPPEAQDLILKSVPGGFKTGSIVPNRELWVAQFDNG